MIRTVLFATCLIGATPAFAQDQPPPDSAPPVATPGPFDISGEISLMSDYRFRGISRSDEDPALQAGIDIRHDSGLYIGARGTTLAGNDRYRLRNPGFRDQGDVEMDLYAGYGRSLGGGFDLDAGVMYYAFAGGSGATDYAEPYASLSYLIGPVQMTEAIGTGRSLRATTSAFPGSGAARSGCATSIPVCRRCTGRMQGCRQRWS
jgi:uncharacterized protein (TIGR02001 family)